MKSVFAKTTVVLSLLAVFFQDTPVLAQTNKTVLAGNFAREFITESDGLAVGETDLTLSGVDQFPALSTTNEYYYLVLLNGRYGHKEIVKVTAVNTGTKTLTIERAQDGTTEKAFDRNDRVEMWMTAGLLRDFADYNAGVLNDRVDITDGNVSNNTARLDGVDTRMSGVVETNGLSIHAFNTNLFMHDGNTNVTLKTGVIGPEHLSPVYPPNTVLGNAGSTTGALENLTINQNLGFGGGSNEVASAKAAKDYADALLGTQSVLHPNVVQQTLTGYRIIYNHASETLPVAEGNAGSDTAFWLAQDDVNTMQVAITPRSLNSKVRIKVDLQISSSASTTPAAGKFQRSIDGGLNWTDLLVGDSSLTRVPVTTVSGWAGYDRRMSHHNAEYIDTPGAAASVLYRWLVTVYPDQKILINAGWNLDSSGKDNASVSLAEYRSASVIIAQELYQP